MSYENPEEIGESFRLTRDYPATDSYVKDDAGNLQPMVHGYMAKAAEVDIVASHHFGEQILKWTLCLVAKNVRGSVKDETFMAVKPSTVKGLRERFPGAFDEFISKFGDDEICEPVFEGAAGMHPSLIGKYVEKPVRFGKSIADRKAALMRELKGLEAAEANTPSEHQPEENEGYADHVDLQGGHPLAGLKGVPAKSKEVLANINVVTIEGLANLSDYVIPELPVGNWTRYRTLAQQKLVDLQKHAQAA